MWFGRTYWHWNIRIWLALAFAFLLVGAVSDGQPFWPDDVYTLTLLTEIWIMVSLATWFILVLRHAIIRAFHRVAHS